MPHGEQTRVLAVKKLPDLTITYYHAWGSARSQRNMGVTNSHH